MIQTYRWGDMDCLVGKGGCIILWQQGSELIHIFTIRYVPTVCPSKSLSRCSKIIPISH